ncbi:MAG: 30S ribosomal protein S20 [Rhodospirillales bacterium]|jgi:small subunit ribosomal protein S20|nr:30S ribosomal protein S20 [Rhodospirillales bacterium]HIJ42958.1 30S ribosomal protein S20 [Rhodospirillaceae bacterium]MDP7215579.1 30S ribosomal protein S20 [Rhodospirillales bacterium]HIJ45478.1 30S ribosomal protein S20 [Rhodospirillaceae bacterium]HIJ93073.1 30S ribosomal protein S20 [Rhodospirillaceae bacterium]
MATHASAKKSIRQIKRRTRANGIRRSRVRLFIKKVEAAIASGDKELAAAAFREAQPEMMRAARNRIFHRNQIARKLSRLSARIKAIAA